MSKEAPPRTEAELESRLSWPSPQLVEELRGIGGDIVILGAGGKMGPTLAMMARRALDSAGRQDIAVRAVSRWSDTAVREKLERVGVQPVAFELSLDADLSQLPDAAALVYMVGTKFGSSGNPAHTWMTNAVLPAIVARRYRDTPISALSTGNVYPLVPTTSKGSNEHDEPMPVGEYAMSCLGRERAFEYAAAERRTRVALIRLNYAVEMRYGVLADIATKVLAGEPIDVTTGYVNVIWQRYVNEVVLRSLSEATSGTPFILNVTGVRALSVREIAQRFATLFGTSVSFLGKEADTALLSDARRCFELFGEPDCDEDELIAWQAAWLRAGGPLLGKPTKFERRDGQF